MRARAIPLLALGGLAGVICFVRLGVDPQATGIAAVFAVACAVVAVALSSRRGWPRFVAVVVTMTVALTPSMGPDAEPETVGPMTLGLAAIVLLVLSRRATGRIAEAGIRRLRSLLGSTAEGIVGGARAVRSGVRSWWGRRLRERIGDGFVALGVIGLIAALGVIAVQIRAIPSASTADELSVEELTVERRAELDRIATYQEVLLAEGFAVDAVTVRELRAVELLADETSSVVGPSASVRAVPSHEDLIFPIRASDNAGRRTVMVASSFVAIGALFRARRSLRLVALGVLGASVSVAISGAGASTVGDGPAAIDVVIRLALLVLVVDLAAALLDGRGERSGDQPTGTA